MSHHGNGLLGAVLAWRRASEQGSAWLVQRRHYQSINRTLRHWLEESKCRTLNVGWKAQQKPKSLSSFRAGKMLISNFFPLTSQTTELSSELSRSNIQPTTIPGRYSQPCSSRLWNLVSSSICFDFAKSSTVMGYIKVSWKGLMCR